MSIRKRVVRAWELLKKPTTPVHLLYGFMAAYLCYRFGFWIGGAAMVGFALWEAWNDRNEAMRKAAKGKPYVYEGDHDFWESTITFFTGLITWGILIDVGVL